MPKLDDAKLLADSYLTEIEAMIEIYKSYNELIVGKAQALFVAFAQDDAAKMSLQSVTHKAG